MDTKNTPGNTTTQRISLHKTMKKRGYETSYTMSYKMGLTVTQTTQTCVDNSPHTPRSTRKPTTTTTATKSVKFPIILRDRKQKKTSG